MAKLSASSVMSGSAAQPGRHRQTRDRAREIGSAPACRENRSGARTGARRLRSASMALGRQRQVEQLGEHAAVGFDELAVHARRRRPGAGTRRGADAAAASRRRASRRSHRSASSSACSGRRPATAAAPAAAARVASTSALKRSACATLADQRERIVQRVDPRPARGRRCALHPVPALAPVDAHVAALPPAPRPRRAPRRSGRTDRPQPGPFSVRRSGRRDCHP